jgi:hypothetical protein
VRPRVADPARISTPLAIAFGLVALAARAPSAWAILVTAAAGVIGILGPLPARLPARLPAGAPAGPAARGGTRAARAGTWLAAAALGIGAMLVAGRLPGLVGIAPKGLLARRAGVAAVAASVVAAVAEEAFFRRLVYGWLATWGPAVAIGGSAVAFAAVHVPAYGLAVFPIDAAAGALLGWQRWMTGGWSASGVTHVVANLIAEGVIA